MNSQETLLVFAAIALVFSLLAIIIDWFGKPMRGRKFIPKIYRYPDERMPRNSGIRPTQWSEAAFVLPVPAPVAARLEEKAAEEKRRAEAEALARYEHEQRVYEEEQRLYEEEQRRYEEEQRQYERELAQYQASLRGGPARTAPAVPEPSPQADPLVETAAGLLFGGEDEPPGVSSSADPAVAAVATSASEPQSVAQPAAPPEPANATPAPAQPAPKAKNKAAKAKTPQPESSADRAPETTKAKRKGSAQQREKGWSVGDYIFNLSSEGKEPSPATVRNRYWRNVSAAKGSNMFGARNQERMAKGKAPQRRNGRTGKMESMHLPALSFAETDGATPVPSWPTSDVDPFAK